MRKFTTIFFFFGMVAVSSAQKSWPKSLLWRITGKNLEQPSFLYGTMHLQDKRLFYFGDSLYYYLEKVDGYALEVDLQEFLDSVIQRAMQREVDEMWDDKKIKADEEKKTIDSLVKNIKERYDKASKKEIERIRSRRIKRILKDDRMSTIVDAYLFGVAKRHGKWVGGIEDVEDQVTVLDELGKDIDKDELTGSDADLKSFLEEMISVYLDADLNKIEKLMLNEGSLKFKDIVFRKRNIKMSRRMDSLMNIRTMFFAVGAAHLPGDSGVIHLLRHRGYTVEPVFSTEKVDPDKYSATLEKLPWIRVEDEKKTYTIEMPGQPSDINVFGESFKLKVHIDISTLTYYMTGSAIAESSSGLDDILREFSKKLKNGVISGKRSFEKEGTKGIEATVSSEGIYYKIQYFLKKNIIYMIMAGGQNKNLLSSADVKRYFSSFAISEINSQTSLSNWQAFTLEDKGFTIMLPGMPKRNSTLEKHAEGTNWTFNVYDYSDMTSGVFYMVQVRDLVPGYYLTGDSAYFVATKENLKQTIKEVKRDEIIKIQEFPALRYDGNAEHAQIIFSTLTVNRGNRVYTLLAGSANGQNDPQVARFFESFTITDYKPSEGKKQVSPGKEFYSVVPAEFKKIQKVDSDDVYAISEKKDHYISYNPNTVISYEVFKETLSEYYWTLNDSSFFAEYGTAYKGFEDSVVSHTPVTNGKLKGHEWVIQMPNNNNIKKVRVVLNGDTLYTLLTFIPLQYINGRDHQQFFDEFRAVNESATTSVFKNKSERIFRDLQTKDSATFTKASGAIPSAAFTKADLPLLHQGLVTPYLDDTVEYYNTRKKIVSVLQGLSDSTTVNYIQSHFAGLTGEKASLQFDLIDVLLHCETSYSYATLKDLLLHHAPKEVKDDSRLGYPMTDSSELAKTLFPEILSLTGNKLFVHWVISTSLDLLDSNAITLEMLRPYETAFLNIADTSLVSLLKRTDINDAYRFLNMLKLLAAFNDDMTNKMLQDYLAVNDLTIKEQTVLSLLKNNQPVDSKQIEKLAADKGYRKDLYDELKKIGKESLFPGKYLSQRYMSECEIYLAASDEDEPSEIVFLTDKTFTFDGNRQRFFLYKVMYEYDGEKTQYLGVAGPYSLNSKEIETSGDATGLYWKEELNSKKIDSYFKKFMEEMEAYKSKSN